MVLIFPGFEKLPVVAFTLGVFASSCVQERWIQNCFPGYLSQVWTPLMSCCWTLTMAAAEHQDIRTQLLTPGFSFGKRRPSNGSEAAGSQRWSAPGFTFAARPQPGLLRRLLWCSSVVLWGCEPVALRGCWAAWPVRCKCYACAVKRQGGKRKRKFNNSKEFTRFR